MTTAMHPPSPPPWRRGMPPQQRPVADNSSWRHAVLTPAPEETLGERRARYFDECRVGMDCGRTMTRDEGDDLMERRYEHPPLSPHQRRSLPRFAGDDALSNARAPIRAPCG